jgi:hypothetical protein
MDSYVWVITDAWKEMFDADLVLILELVLLYYQSMRERLCPFDIFYIFYLDYLEYLDKLFYLCNLGRGSVDV